MKKLVCEKDIQKLVNEGKKSLLCLGGHFGDALRERRCKNRWH